MPLYRQFALVPGHPQMWLINVFVAWFIIRRYCVPMEERLLRYISFQAQVLEQMQTPDLHYTICYPRFPAIGTPQRWECDGEGGLCCAGDLRRQTRSPEVQRAVHVRAYTSRIRCAYIYAHTRVRMRSHAHVHG